MNPISEVLKLHSEDLFRGHLSNGCRVCGPDPDVGYPCKTVHLLTADDQVIPDEAVEAAAYTLYLDANPASEVQWFDIGFHEQNELMRTAKKAIEAAMPYLLAQGWDEGWQACVNYTTFPEVDGEPPTDDNPYRTQP